MAEVVNLPENYGYKSRTAEDEQELITTADLPIAKIEDWLSPDAQKVTKWVKLPSRDARVLISAITSREFKKLRNDAPNINIKGRNGKIKVEKDEDWIQEQMIMRFVIEPKITNPEMLEHGLAGDISFLVIEISKLSGFDVEKAIRDALE